MHFFPCLSVSSQLVFFFNFFFPIPKRTKHFFFHSVGNTIYTMNKMHWIDENKPFFLSFGLCTETERTCDLNEFAFVIQFHWKIRLFKLFNSNFRAEFSMWHILLWQTFPSKLYQDTFCSSFNMPHKFKCTET